MLLVHLLVLLCTLLGLSSTQKSKPIDVLARLKAKAPDCDLKRFVLDEANWKLLEEDLTKFCSASPKELTEYSVVLCRALSSELLTACRLSEDARPSPAKYDLKTTAEEICSPKKVILTTEWIWKKLKLDDKISGLTKENFCSKLAEADETRRLVRFFYKIAPRVRQADLANTTGQITETAKKVAGEVKGAAAKVEEKAWNAGQTVKATAEQLVNATKGELNGTIVAVNGTVAKLLDKGNEAVHGALEVGKTIVNETKDLIEAGKSKVNETVTEVKDAVASAVNKTIEVIKTGADLVKSGVGAVLNGTINAPIPATNATSELVSNSTVAVPKNVTQPILDVKLEKTTTIIATKKKEAANEDEDEDEDEEDEDADEAKKKPKETEPTGQIPKPNLGVETKNTNVTNVLVVPPAGEKNPIVPEVPPVKPPTTAPAIEAEKEPEDVEPKKKVTVAIPQEEGDEYDAGNKGADAGRVDGAEEDTENEDKPKKKINNNEEDQDDPFALDPEDDTEKEYSLHNDEDRDDDEGETEKKPIPSNRIAEPRQPEKKIKDKEVEPIVYRPANTRNRYPEDEGWSGSFVTYFLLLTLFVVVGYLVLHNKNKLMGYFVEGRRTGSSRTGSRPSHRHYEQIKNVNDVIDLDMNTNTGGSTKKDPNLL